MTDRSQVLFLITGQVPWWFSLMVVLGFLSTPFSIFVTSYRFDGGHPNKYQVLSHYGFFLESQLVIAYSVLC